MTWVAGFGELPRCTLRHVGCCTIRATCGFSLDVSPETKWPNLILFLFQVVCQGAKLVLGLPLPLILMGNLDISHGRIKWRSTEGQGQKAPHELHVVQTVPASPNLPRLSSTPCCSSSHVKRAWGACASSVAAGELGCALISPGLFWFPLDETPKTAGRGFLGHRHPHPWAQLRLIELLAQPLF